MFQTVTSGTSCQKFARRKQKGRKSIEQSKIVVIQYNNCMCLVRLPKSQKYCF